MSNFSIATLFIYFLVWGIPNPSQAQAITKGRITDSETGMPLSGVHVFLSGTQIGTATNQNGQYRLKRIPHGGHRLVVSHIGYKKELTSIIIGPGQTKAMDFKLTPVIYELPEIFVGNLGKKWEKKLRRFTDLFIGSSEWADSVRILNPEVLRFKTRWFGRLSAEALAPLEIENRALGYHIIYYLDEFHHNGLRTRWDGEPLFTEMTPSDSSQANYWKENRKEAFYGSLRHFLLALLQGRLKEKGFILYTIRESVHDFSPRNRFPVKAKHLIDEGEKYYLHHFNFFGRLEIIYTKDQEDWNYVRWQRSARKSPAAIQTSYLELNDQPITIDSDGEILEPYGATQFGYFAFQRIAYATPREYRPKDYALIQ